MSSLFTFILQYVLLQRKITHERLVLFREGMKTSLILCGFIYYNFAIKY